MSRERQLVLPEIVLDRTSRIPVYRQLARQLAKAIQHEAPHDARLPSTRVLAKMLGVSRNTVLSAYDELVARGIAEGRHGSATRVLRSEPAVPSSFATRAVLRDAQYPARTLSISDLDGAPIYITY